MNIKQKLGIIVALGTLLVLLPVAGCASGAVEKEPVVFADGGWDSIQVHNRIAAFILEHGYGYLSEFIAGETIPHATGLVRGDIDVNMELWVESMVDVYRKAIESGDAIDLGTNFPDSWQGWLVPSYVVNGDPERGIEAMAPDLKSVEDLPEYWELFKDPEDPTKGRFYSCIPGWECERINEQKFEAYGLGEYYNIFHPGSGPALVGSMVAAYEKGEPWVGYYWEPTWVLGKLDMYRLEEPPWNKEIWETTKACAYPSGQVNIVVHKSLLDRAPKVVEFLGNYETTTEMNNKILAYMQDNEAEVDQGAIWFLKEYQSVWTEWVPSGVASKVKKALP